MSSNTGHGAQRGWKPRTILPVTRPGRWAVLLTAASVLLMMAWTVLPGGGVIPLVCGLAGGVIALVAIFRHGERALAVLVALVPFLWAVAFVVAEIVELIVSL